LGTDSPTRNPEGWWKYCVSSTRETVNKKYYKWTWDYFLNRKNAKLQYMELYKKKKVDKKLDKKKAKYTRFNRTSIYL